MDCLFDSLNQFLGRTVTIFTTSGGLSGSGFTGVLVAVFRTHIKLITDIGAAPDCPVGSSCTGFWPNYGYGYGYGCGCGGNLLGSVTEIPIAAIASFTHSAI